MTTVGFKRGVATCVARLLGTDMYVFASNGTPHRVPLTMDRMLSTQVGELIASQCTQLQRQAIVVVPAAVYGTQAYARSMFGQRVELDAETISKAAGLPVHFVSSTEALGAWLRSGVAGTGVTVHPRTVDLRNPTAIRLEGELGIVEVVTTSTHIVITAGTSHAAGHTTIAPEPTAMVLRNDLRQAAATLTEMLGHVSGVSNVVVHCPALPGVEPTGEPWATDTLRSLDWPQGVLAVNGNQYGLITGIRQLLADA